MTKTPETEAPGQADYPKMLYHPDGRTMIAADAEEHRKLSHEGWEQTPSPIHLQQQPTTSGLVSGDEPLAKLIRNVLEAVLDERGLVKVEQHRKKGA